MPIADALRRGWDDFFYRGFSGESLGLLRVYFGIGLLPLHVSEFYTLLTLDPFGARFPYLYPVWYFDLLGVTTHAPLVAFLAFACLIAATCGMIAGKWTRTSIAVVIAMVFYLQGARDSFSGDTHHRFLVPMQVLLLLLVSRCGSVRSLDERARAVKSRIEEWEASWPIKAMQLYAVSFYFWAVIAKLRVSGLAWFGGGRLQEVLLRRSAMWGLDHEGQAIENTLAFQIAQMPELLALLGAATFVMEAGFPLVLLVRRPLARFVFLLGVTVFHVLNFVLLYVGFVFFPVVFLIFFDLVPVHAWLVAHLPGRAATAGSSPSVGGAGASGAGG